MEQDSKSAYETAQQARDARAEHRDQLIDQALMDTFPASDPISYVGFD